MQWDFSILRPLGRLWRAWNVKRHSCRHRKDRERDAAADQMTEDLLEEHAELRANIASLRAVEQVALRPFMSSVGLHINGMKAAIYRVNAELENAAIAWEQEEANEEHGAEEITLLERETLGEKGALPEPAPSAQGLGPPLPTVQE